MFSIDAYVGVVCKALILMLCVLLFAALVQNELIVEICNMNNCTSIDMSCVNGITKYFLHCIVDKLLWSFYELLTWSSAQLRTKIKIQNPKYLCRMSVIYYSYKNKIKYASLTVDIPYRCKHDGNILWKAVGWCGGSP